MKTTGVEVGTGRSLEVDILHDGGWYRVAIDSPYDSRSYAHRWTPLPWLAPAAGQPRRSRHDLPRHVRYSARVRLNGCRDAVRLRLRAGRRQLLADRRQLHPR